MNAQRDAIVVAAARQVYEAKCLRDSAAGKAPEFGYLIASYWADVLVGYDGPSYPKQWCGALALFCLHSGGVALDVHWEVGKGFLYRLHTTPHPEPGDVAYLDAPFQHHAIVTHIEGESVVTVNGNQGPTDPIQIKTHPLKHWTAFYSIAPWLEPDSPPRITQVEA